MSTLVPRYLVGLELSRLGGDDLHQIAASVKQAAPTSALVQSSPAMQACVTSMGTSDAAYAASSETVAQTQNKLRLDVAADAQCQSTLVGDIRTMVTLTTNVAKSPADVHSVGLPPAGPKAPKNQPPTVPEQVDNKPPKQGHGKTTVSVHETGPTRHQYVAEQSGDGITWAPLGVGHGKTRVVTGASGAKVWVRFAMVRAGMQSDWSTAVLVTIP